MTFDIFALNWWAILVATLSSFLLGGLWYGPLFGKRWLRALGKSEYDLAPSAVPFVVAFVTSFITCVALAWLISLLGISTWERGALMGMIVGVAFIACSSISDGAFCRFSWTLLSIQAVYRILHCVIAGVIFAIW
ncbi:MAG: DUF1761 domain-containing protein [Gammaproteobacteria bacterium]|nr:DUF1761 domain-containing protein [Gammaproteobacteria bacterium]MYF38359.1 DUF1761 domain-containing protein [Gammaproteobacteria bacterium]